MKYKRMTKSSLEEKWMSRSHCRRRWDFIFRVALDGTAASLSRLSERLVCLVKYL